MKNEDKYQISIILIDDNNFYVQLVHRWIRNFFNSPLYTCDYQINLQSYTNTNQINLTNVMYDIAFIDYYLEDGKTAMDVIPMFKKYQPQCRIYIVSQNVNDLTAIYTLDHGATGFIHKGDKHVLQKTCSLIKDLFTDDYQQEPKKLLI